MTFSEKMNILLGLPKSVFYNLKWFGFKKGIVLPVLIGRKCIVSDSTGAKITIPIKTRTGNIKIGINEGPFLKGRGEFSYFKLSQNAQIIFKGKCNINAGSVINISSGICEFGDEFAANAHFLLSCENEIRFKDKVLFGWDCTVIDGDGHTVISTEDGKKCNQSKPIVIGNHVWIGAKTTILKGIYISDNTIVAYGSLVTKSNQKGYAILAGDPARIVKGEVDWIR